ncbi:MAG: MopE-related protein [Saprospiraceae bacterium]|nr:MopE-related protein [Saprospiraceae bacterium]
MNIAAPCYRSFFIVCMLGACTVGFATEPENFKLSLRNCDRPELLQVLGTTDSTALLTWTDVADEYELEVIPASGGFSGQPTHTALPDPPFLLTNLTPGVQYRFVVRAVCTGQTRSVWSLPRNVSTAINRSRPCPLNLSLPDTTCRRFPIYVDDAPGASLGTDVLLDEVRIVLEHPWRSDLRLFLEAPDGTRIQLAGGFNAGDDHLGAPATDNCTPAFILTDAAYAQPIGSASGVNSPTGYFRPLQPLGTLLNGQAPNGIWHLEICDDKIDDAGVLRQLGLVFHAIGCPRPDSLWMADVSADQAVVKWTPAFPGDVMLIEYGPSGYLPGLYSLPGTGSNLIPVADADSVTLPFLTPLTAYDVYLRRRCADGTWSANGQAVSFFTACPPTLHEGADSLGLCPSGCADPCATGPVWQNVTPGDDFEWKVRTGPGIAWPNAGPPAAVGGSGNYLYFRNSCSFNGANGKTAALRTRCILLQAPPIAPCHFSFDLYMFASIGQMGKLELQVSTNGGQSWSTIRTWNGNQEKAWKREYLRLEAYDGQTVQLQFVATGALGAYGDIAMDNLDFYGAQLVGNPGFVFFRDQDNDGWGLENLPLATCSAVPPSGYVPTPGDCDDANPNVHPGIPEIRCNGIDENCNGVGDDAPPLAPAAAGDTVCRGELAELSVPGGQGNYFWFSDPSGGQVAATGNVWVLQPPLQTRMYYVADSVQGLCAGPRTPVELLVLETPGLTGPSSLTLCLGNSIDLSTTGVQDTFSTAGPILYYSALPPQPSYLLDTALVSPSADTVYYAIKSAPSGCTSTWDLPVQVRPLPTLTLNAADTLRLCRGEQEVVVATCGGGTPPYAFEWSTGLRAPQVVARAGAVPGTVLTLSVNASDAAGCTASDSLRVETLGGVSQTQVVQVLPAGACGGSDGAIVLRPLDGTPPYTFLWTGPQTGMITDAPAGETALTGLQPGAYRVTIIDGSGTGCGAALPQIVVNAPGFSVALDTVIQPLCAGDNNGSIHLTITGANPQVTWSDGQTGPVANGLTAGLYAATVTVGGCVQVLDSLPVDDPATLDLLVNSIGAEQCLGDSSGVIDIEVAGGTSPYHLIWSDGFEGEDRLGLGQGFYAVSVLDANGCTVSQDSIMVPGPDTALSVLIEEQAVITCFGENTGQLRASASGGTSPYTFLWSTGQYFETLYGLNAGTYTVTLTDANKCTAQAAFQLAEPDMLLVDLQVKQPTCAGSKNGSAQTSTSGGIPPYIYAWNTGGQTAGLIHLDAGAYRVTVTDRNGCVFVSDTAMLFADQVMQTALDSFADVRCAGVDEGYLAVTVVGGEPPLVFTWDGQGGGPVLPDAGAGAHLLEVSDSRNCRIRDTFFLQGPETPMLIQVESIGDVFCAGDPTGRIDLTTSGGTPPYRWLWNNGAQTEDLPAVEAGVYSVSIQDSLGCPIDGGPWAVNEPPLLAAEAFITDIPCFGPQSGSIELTAVGGVPPYAYRWNTGSLAMNLYNLSKGAYTVTVSDATGCAVVLSDLTVVRKNDLFDIHILSVKPVSCNEAGDGAIVVSVDNGRAPFQFSWTSPIGLHPNKPFPRDTALLLTGGTYWVQVSDADGCIGGSDTVYIEEAPQIKLGFGGDFQLACKGDSTAVAQALTSGGLPPYQYLWSTGDSSVTISNLPAGFYRVSLTDQQGCMAMAGPLQIQEPDQPLAVSAVDKEDDFCGTGLGSIRVWAAGGKQPYTYAWSNGHNTALADSLAVGIYTLTLTDVLGCVLIVPDYIIEGASMPVTASLFSIEEPGCFGDSTGAASLVASGGYGGYSYFWSDGWSGPIRTNMPAGAYTVTVLDAEGCTDTIQPELAQPEALSATWMADSLPGGWEVTLTPAGGTSAYGAVWGPEAGGQTGLTATGLASGNYSATVTDANGCTLVVSGISTGSSPTLETTTERSVRLFPNPSPGWATLIWDGADKDRLLHIYDQQGVCRWSHAPASGEPRLDVRLLLPTGTYWLTGSAAQGEVFRIPLIIVR